MQTDYSLPKTNSPIQARRDIVIIGAGGFGKEIAWLIERINTIDPIWNLLGFVDDDNTKVGQNCFGLPVLGTINWLNNQSNDLSVVGAIGNPIVRQSVISRIKKHKFATLVDPSVICSESVRIGEGSIICAGSILTVDINIGTHTIINLDCAVGHDAVLGNFVTLYPSVNISGNVNVKECAEIGTGVQIIQGVIVGERTVVGAGAVVVQDLPSKCTAVGAPAKPIKFHK